MRPVSVVPLGVQVLLVVVGLVVVVDLQGVEGDKVLEHPAAAVLALTFLFIFILHYILLCYQVYKLFYTVFYL